MAVLIINYCMLNNNSKLSKNLKHGLVKKREGNEFHHTSRQLSVVINYICLIITS